MKKCIFLPVFLLTCLTVFAQDVREIRIFVPPVAGIGRAGDNAFFHRLLSSEVVFQYYSLVRSQRNCDYILKASITRLTDEERITESATSLHGPVPSSPVPAIRNEQGVREYFSWEIDDGIYFYDTSGEDNYTPNSESADNPEARITSHEFALVLELINNSSGAAVNKQQLSYSSIDASIGDLLSILVYNMLSSISDIKDTESWRENWFFFETSALWAPRVYTFDQIEQENLSNFGFKFALEFQLLQFLSFGVGLQFVREFVTFDEIEYLDMMMEIPLAIKFVIKFPGIFILEPYGGIIYNYSLMDVIQPSHTSWLAGLQVGIKAGPGMIVLDPRYYMDIESSVIAATNTGFQRSNWQFGLGYKIGFFKKNPRAGE